MAKKRKAAVAFKRPSRGYDASRGAAGNPFQDRWARRAANAAAKAGSHRRESLVAELRASERANSFVDRRIGESNEHLSAEDKYLARLQRERSKRVAKRARFNLSDDQEESHGPGSGVPLFAESNRVLDDANRVNSQTPLRASSDIKSSILRDDYVEEELVSDDEASTDGSEGADAPPAVENLEGSKGDEESGLESAGLKRVDGTGSDSNHRTHKEIMEEVIAKSKQYKAERQKEKAHIDKETADLDDRLPQIMQLLDQSENHLPAPRRNTQREAEQKDRERSNLFEASDRSASGELVAPGKSRIGDTTGKFDYESIYNELSTAKRAYATERTKTDEEKDADERERLLNLERLRQRRMTALDDEDGESDDSEEAKTTKKQARPRGADDLDDDFEIDVRSPRAHYSDSDDISGGDDEGESSSEDADDKDAMTADQSTDYSVGEDSDDVASANAKAKSTTNERLEGRRSRAKDFESDVLEALGDRVPSLASKNSVISSGHDLKTRLGPSALAGVETEASQQDMSTEEFASGWVWPPREPIVKDDDLPFAFSDTPSTVSELTELFHELTSAQKACTLSRMRKCFAISLNPTENRRKLEALLSILLLYIDHVLDISLTADSSDLLSSIVNEIDTLVPEVYMLGQIRPQGIAEWSRGALEAVYHELSTADGPAMEQRPGAAETWTVDRLLRMRVISRLFPATDMRHAVLTPAMYLLANGLTHLAVRDLRDASCAVYSASVLLDLLRPAQRFSGDLMTFLGHMLCSVDRSSKPSHSFVRTSLLADATHQECGGLELWNCMVDGGKHTSVPQDLMATRVLSAVCSLVRGAVYEGELKCIRACCAPVLAALQRHSERPILAALQADLMDMCKSEEQHRKPLTLYTQKRSDATPRLLNPRFSSDSGIYHGKRQRRLDSKPGVGALNAELEAQRRVRQALKKEARGAARELRKDSELVRAERQRELDDNDAQRLDAGRKARMFLHRQQQEAKQQTKRPAMGIHGLAAEGRRRKKW